jgi:hypothetical protein
MDQAALVVIAKQTAERHGLDPVLICAIVEQESAWNTRAVRLENGFYHKYMVPMVEKGTVLISDAVLRSASFGLGQTMLESLREIGFAGTPEELTAPAIGLEWLCVLFQKKLDDAGGNIQAGLLHWNGGGNPSYPAEVLARESRYVQPADLSMQGDL